MKKLYFSVFLLIICLISKSQIVNLQWAKNMGGASNDVGKSITKDAAGNVYTTGYYSGTVDFDPGPGTFTLSALGLNDIFVTKLTSAGNFVWAKSMGGTSDDNGLSLALDASGNVYTTGYFFGTADFDPGAPIFNLISLGDEDIFISKLDASGNFVWAKSMGGTLGDISNAIEIDASGNIYTTGVFQGTTDFDPGIGTFTIAGSLNGDVYVSKWNSSGNFTWAQSFSGTVGDNGTSIALDATGVYVSGYFSATVDFDPGPGVSNLISNGNQDIFIAKLSVSGIYIWAKNIGGSNNDFGNSIKVDGLGNVYTTGGFDGTVDFDPGVGTSTITSSGGTDVFISKLNVFGNFVFAKNIGGTGNDIGKSMARDALGNIYIIGSYAGTADFDPGVGIYTTTAVGLEDIFISKFDDQGNFIWTKTMGGLNNDIGNSISVDASDNVYSTGEFNGLVDFDPNGGISNLNSFGGQDIFVHKLSQCFVPAAPVNVTNVNNQTICDGKTTTLSATSNVTVNWYATPTSTLSLGSGTNYVTPALTVGSYSYYAEAASCTISLTRTIFTITVNNNPTVTAVSNMSFICAGQSATLSAAGADSYTWSTGGNSVSEIVSPSVTTNFTVSGSDVNGCTTAVVVSQSVNACIGIEEKEFIKTDVLIYPNPTSTIINIEFLAFNNDNVQMQIMNTLGEIVFDEIIAKSKSLFNISDLPSGIYFVKLMKNAAVKNVKIIKEN